MRWFDEKKFLKLYRERYALPWETLTDCSKRIVNNGIEAIEEEEYVEFREMVWECLDNPDEKYKDRTILGKAMELWAWYWPKCNRK